METNVALGGWTFKLTRHNNFYFGPRWVAVTDGSTRERIIEAITYDRVSELRDIFKELGGSTKASR
jgi:hypothetical protein